MRFYAMESKGPLFALTFLFLFFLKASEVNAQEKTSVVKGLVQSDNNVPLAGVSVILRNSKTNFTLGTSTDSSGSFNFSRVPAGGPFSFTFSTVGFETQTLSGYNIKDDVYLALMVKMKSSIASLDQVVVVGYGTQRRKDLTGSVASVGSREIKDLAIVTRASTIGQSSRCAG